MKRKERQAIEAEDKALLDAVRKDERITEAQRPKYAAILKADRVNGNGTVPKDLKPKRLVTDVLDEPGKDGCRRMGETYAGNTGQCKALVNNTIIN